MALFYVDYPLAWARGGHAIQIWQTAENLRQLGVSVEWLRHESDIPQNADLIHYWSRPRDSHWKFARERRLKIVISSMNPVGAARSRAWWFGQRIVGTTLRPVLGDGLYERLGLEIYREADAVLTLTPRERDYHVTALGAPPDRTFVIPNGVDEVFLVKESDAEAFDGLLCCAFISRVKRQVELAKTAREAGVKIRFVGGPQVGEDAYFEEFRKQIDGEHVQWVGEVKDRGRLAAFYRGARGLILASRYEALGLCLLESLAVGTPVMAPDLPTLRSYYGNSVRYAPDISSRSFPACLRRFYDECCSGLKQSFPVQTWRAVAEQVLNVYQRVTDRSV